MQRLSKDAFVLKERNIYIFERSATIQKFQLNESTKRNASYILRDTSPWRVTNSEKCDVWRN